MTLERNNEHGKATIWRKIYFKPSNSRIRNPRTTRSAWTGPGPDWSVDPWVGSDKSGTGQIIPNMFDNKNVIILDSHLIGGDKAGLSLVEKFWTSINMNLKYVSIKIYWRCIGGALSLSTNFKSLLSYHVMSTIEFLGLFHIFHNTFHIRRSMRLFWNLIMPQKGPCSKWEFPVRG